MIICDRKIQNILKIHSSFDFVVQPVLSTLTRTLTSIYNHNVYFKFSVNKFCSIGDIFDKVQLS